MIFLLALCIGLAVVMPPWLMWKHCGQMDSDPEYRRRARERGW